MLIIGCGLYAIFVALFSRSIADYDLWGYLSFGSVFWDKGYFPFQDVFSYTSVKPLWIYHEWLTGLIFYYIYKHTGPAGLQLLRYVVVFLTIYLIYLTALKKGGGTLSTLFCLVPAMLLVSFGYVPVRAQIFTYLFFILTIYVLESARKEQQWALLWWLLPVEILWCNLHGGFVAGLGLIILYILGDWFSGRRIKPLILIAFPATIVTLINPYGFKYWGYALQAITMPRPEIDEWMSVIEALQRNVQAMPVLIFLFLALLFLVLQFFCRERNLTDLLVIAVTIYVGCKHIRHSILYGLVLGSHLPVLLSVHWRSWQAGGYWATRQPWLPQSLLVVFLAFFYWSINPSLSIALAPRFTMETPAPDYPVGALKWIEDNKFQGNILPHFEWGEFIIWTCYPACRVAMDGRYETVYQEQTSREYFDFLLGRDGWRVFLTRYRHDMVLIKPNTKTHLLMLREPSWRLAYADGGSVLFVRNHS